MNLLCSQKLLQKIYKRFTKDYKRLQKIYKRFTKDQLILQIYQSFRNWGMLVEWHICRDIFPTREIHLPLFPWYICVIYFLSNTINKKSHFAKIDLVVSLFSVINKILQYNNLTMKNELVKMKLTVKYYSIDLSGEPSQPLHSIQNIVIFMHLRNSKKLQTFKTRCILRHLTLIYRYLQNFHDKRLFYYKCLNNLISVILCWLNTPRCMINVLLL